MIFFYPPPCPQCKRRVLWILMLEVCLRIDFIFSFTPLLPFATAGSCLPCCTSCSAPVWQWPNTQHKSQFWQPSPLATRFYRAGSSFFGRSSCTRHQQNGKNGYNLTVCLAVCAFFTIWKISHVKSETNLSLFVTKRQLKYIMNIYFICRGCEVIVRSCIIMDNGILKKMHFFICKVDNVEKEATQLIECSQEAVESFWKFQNWEPIKGIERIFAHKGMAGK